MKIKNVLYILFVVALILIVPLVLTLINPNSHINGGEGGGWDWMPGDFIVMGMLLFFTGFALDFVIGKLNKPLHKIIAAIIIIVVFLLAWAELAVGILGTPFAGS